MALLTPPPAPPHLNLGDDDRLKRYRMRMTQIITTLVTLLLAAWVCTFGAIAAICAVMIAKHVLVAVIAMGVGLNASGSANR